MSQLEQDKLQQAISALETQRPILGDAVVDTALAPLREKLAAMQSARPPEAEADAQQRKFATVLFADIPGFALLNDYFDAEDLRDTVNALWEQLDALILSHGGRIDKHMGNGVMALWGADVVNEDDAERAIRAALSMRQTAGVYFESLPGLPEYIRHEELGLRVGINTGPVIVGLVGTTSEFTAIGDTVNLAARLNQISRAGVIRISHETYSQVRGVFDLEIQPRVQVKGKSEPVQTYLVFLAKPRAFRLQSRGVEGVETSLIGRQAELQHLKDGFLQLFSSAPQLSIVTLVGDMGLGKSRLLYEFTAWFDPRPEVWWLFQGRALPSQGNTPYALLRDMFAFRFRIQDNDSLAVARKKMEDGFAEFMPNDPNPHEKAHVVGQLLGFDFSFSPYLQGILQDPRQIRNLGFASLARFFSAATKIHPVTLLLEDLHWADNGSLEALTYLLENLPVETPLLAICAARPAIFERYPAWAANLPQSTRITLKPLGREDSRSLVDEILQKVLYLPEDLRELIITGAEGNPFYLEELIKMLIDSKVILPGPQTWGVDVERLDAAAIPATLAGVLQARLDRLDPHERASLQRAAVVGRIFWDSAVEALSPEFQAEPNRLQSSLSVLRSKELIYPSLDSTFAGTQEFSFKHALLRDVAYETVLKRQRAIYHGQVADWLNVVSGERRGEFLPIIADHYEKAGQAQKATETLFEAGDQALSVSGFSEAFRFFQRAEALVPPQNQRDQSRIQLKLGEVLLRSGELQNALRHSETALTLARNFSGILLYAAALYQVGQIHAEIGNYPEAERHFNEALPLARAGGIATRDTLARVLFGLGHVHWRLGKLASARVNCQESYQVSQAVGDNNTTLLALNRLAVITGLLGDPNGEETMYLQGLELALGLRNRERAGIFLNNLGALADEMGKLDAAQGFYLRAMDMAREIGAQQSLSLYLINLAHSQIRLGDLENGEIHLREGLALAHHLGSGPWLLTALIFFARLEATRGNLERGLQLLGMAEHHPAHSVDHHRLAEQMLAEWNLDPRFILEQMARGATLDWKQTVQELLVSPGAPHNAGQG